MVETKTEKTGVEKKGEIEFVRVSYTGREKDTGRIFDTTEKEVAVKEGIYSESVNYGPTIMILGANQLIAGFEEVLKKMKPGEKKTVELPPEKAYGNRSPELVKLVPMNVFKRNNIDPHPGMVLMLEGMPARIQTVSGGRVRVDFNHELAGKTLIFDIKLVGKIKDNDEKIRVLFERLFPDVKSKELKVEEKKGEKELELTLPKDVLKVKNMHARKVQLIQDIKRFLGYERVKVSEEY